MCWPKGGHLFETNYGKNYCSELIIWGTPHEPPTADDDAAADVCPALEGAQDALIGPRGRRVVVRADRRSPALSGRLAIDSRQAGG